MLPRSTPTPPRLSTALEELGIERPNSRIYIPLGSSLLLSVVLSLLLSLIMAIISRFR